MEAAGRITTRNWDLYDTSHVVFIPARMTPEELQEGYMRATRDFYRWGSISRSASDCRDWRDRLRHIVYTAGWGSLDALWWPVVKAGQVGRMAPLLEATLTGFGKYPSQAAPQPAPGIPAVGLPWRRRARLARRPAPAVHSRQTAVPATSGQRSMAQLLPDPVARAAPPSLAGELAAAHAVRTGRPQPPAVSAGAGDGSHDT
jgi:hypothetical protein